MILGLQAPIPGIEQKQTKDATQIHRISDAMSHQQRGPTNQTKPTNLAPVPTYLTSGPTKQRPRRRRVAEAAKGFGQPHMAGTRAEIWREARSYLPEGGYPCSHICWWRESTFGAIKGAPHTLSRHSPFTTPFTCGISSSRSHLY